MQLWMKATRPPLTKCERYLGWASAHPPWSSTGPDRPLFFHLAVTDRVHERNRLCSTQDTGSELTMGTWDKNRCVTCCCVLIVCEKRIEAVGRGSCPRMLPVQQPDSLFKVRDWTGGNPWSNSRRCPLSHNSVSKYFKPKTGKYDLL